LSLIVPHVIFGRHLTPPHYALIPPASLIAKGAVRDNIPPG
jgi:hypothetical protein